MEGEQAVRRIQRLWRRYQVAAGEARAALDAVDDSHAASVTTQEQRERRDCLRSAQSLAAAAIRIQNFWRNISFSDRARDGVFSDEEKDGGKKKKMAASQNRNSNDDADDDDDDNGANLELAHRFPKSTAVQRIQRLWRRYRQAVLDHALDQELSECESVRSVASSGGAAAVVAGGAAVSDSGNDDDDDDDDHGSERQQFHHRHDLERSAAIVEHCWRDLRDECESIASHGDDAGDENPVDAASSIQRWWRSRLSSGTPAASATDGNDSAESRVSGSNAGGDAATADGEAGDDAAAQALSPEEAVTALQRRFRLHRLRELFLQHQVRIARREQNAAAETVQRAWRVRRIRQQHREQLHVGLRDSAARRIQLAFRRGRSADPTAATAANPAAAALLHRQQQQQQPVSSSTVEVDAQGRRLMPMCCICLSEEVGVALLPCSHACVCQTCSAVGFSRCPLCRATVAMSIAIYL